MGENIVYKIEDKAENAEADRSDEKGAQLTHILITDQYRGDH